MDSTNSALAQGGIASVISKTDDFSLHIKDTLTAGAGLCKKMWSKWLSQRADRIQDLVNWGFNLIWTKQIRGSFHSLAKEATPIGAFACSRSYWKGCSPAGFASGKNHPNITILDETLAVDLITQKIRPYSFGCDRALGCYVLNKKTRRFLLLQQKLLFWPPVGLESLSFTSNWAEPLGTELRLPFAPVLEWPIWVYAIPSDLSVPPQARNF